jgi:hypothetical protein
MDDKQKIRALKALVAMGMVNQVIWMAQAYTWRETCKKVYVKAKLNHKVVLSFIEQCKEEGRTDILEAVVKDVEFDIIVQDLEF